MTNKPATASLDGEEEDAETSALRALLMPTTNTGGRRRQPSALDLSATLLSSFRAAAVPGKDVHPFKWWAANERFYLEVSSVAKAIFCIPASQAGNERVFSTAGYLSSVRRSRLGADNLSNIAFLAQNLNLQQTQRINKVLSYAMSGVAAAIPSEISNHGIPRDSPPPTCEDACDVEHARLLEEEEALAQDGLLDHDEDDFSDQD
jgi:hypothetical protein